MEILDIQQSQININGVEEFTKISPINNQFINTSGEEISGILWTRLYDLKFAELYL